MKKVICVVIFGASVMIGKSQNKFGLQAGANLGTIKSESGSVSETSKNKVGLIVGALADVDFGNSISFRPELNFIQKGGQFKLSSTQNLGGTNSRSSESEDEYTLSYMQLSPNFVYNVPAGTGKVFFGVGPSFAFGLGGKNKYTETVTTNLGGVVTTKTTSGTDDVKFDGDENATDANIHLKSFDMGANLLAGYALSGGAFLSAGYTFGLSNISPYANTSFKNNGFNIKLGLLFGGNKSKVK